MEIKTASETAAMFGDRQAAIEDRKLFVKNLGWLLSQTRESIESAYLDEHETVHVVYRRNGGEVRVNVSMDSYMAIIRDVAKALR